MRMCAIDLQKAVALSSQTAMGTQSQRISKKKTVSALFYPKVVMTDTVAPHTPRTTPA